jgi:hypothetical protein
MEGRTQPLRYEFNCGIEEGDVYLKNVSLVVAEPLAAEYF